MNLKLRIQDNKTISKTEVEALVEQISYKDNLINSKDAKVQLCFREGSSSGIIELSMAELNFINEKIREEKALRQTKQESVEIVSK